MYPDHVAHAHFVQVVHDREVVDGLINVNVDLEDGTILSYGDAFYAGYHHDELATTVPDVAPQDERARRCADLQARFDAAVHVGIELLEAPRPTPPSPQMVLGDASDHGPASTFKEVLEAMTHADLSDLALCVSPLITHTGASPASSPAPHTATEVPLDPRIGIIAFLLATQDPQAAALIPADADLDQLIERITIEHTFHSNADPRAAAEKPRHLARCARRSNRRSCPLDLLAATKWRRFNPYLAI